MHPHNLPAAAGVRMATAHNSSAAGTVAGGARPQLHRRRTRYIAANHCQPALLPLKQQQYQPGCQPGSNRSRTGQAPAAAKAGGGDGCTGAAAQLQPHAAWSGKAIKDAALLSVSMTGAQVAAAPQAHIDTVEHAATAQHSATDLVIWLDTAVLKALSEISHCMALLWN